MPLKLSIRRKIELYMLGSAIVIYLVVFGYISISTRNHDFDQGAQMVNTTTARYAEQIGSTLNSSMVRLRTLSNSFSTIQNFDGEGWVAAKNSMLREEFRQSAATYSLWDCWEYSLIKKGWDKPTGRTVFTLWKENGTAKEQTSERSLDGDPALYASKKALAKENAFEPYLDEFAAGKSEVNMMTTIMAPMVRDGKFVGMVAEDIVLAQFQQQLEKIKPYDGAEAILISQKGVVIGHPTKQFINKRIDSLITGIPATTGLLDSLNKGQAASFIAKDGSGTKRYYSFSPIAIGKDGVTSWSLCISVPTSAIYQQTNRSFYISMLITLFGLLLFLFVIIRLSHSITTPLHKITGLLNRMARGELDGSMRVHLSTGDEIEQMGTALNTTIEGLIAKSDFAREIGQGNLGASLAPLSPDDRLAHALIEMQTDLTKANAAELRRQHDEKIRMWVADGIALINEKLRQNNHNLELLCKELLRTLVRYVEANQGGVFILNEDAYEPEYIQVAAFAYNRDKLAQKSFLPNEGILGACVVEKQEIYLKELPQDYISITSGLGDANPSNVFIVPLIHEDKVLGVIEIASFTLMEEYQREFILKMADSVASSISWTRNSQANLRLLEESKLFAEQMASQEEEMRQNLEELRSTQEEMSRQKDDLNGFVEALERTCFFVEYDDEGAITNISDMYVNHLGFEKSVALGTNLQSDFKEVENGEMVYRNLMERLAMGETVSLPINRQLPGGETHLFLDTFSAVVSNSRLKRIIKVTQDITHQTAMLQSKSATMAVVGH